MLRRPAFRALAFLLLLLTPGCAQTSRVDDNVTSQSLAAAKTAVALMRIGEAGTACSHVSVLIGVREGEGFRGTKVLTVANVRSFTQAPIAEIELPAGEYHLLAYRCLNQKNNKMIAVGDTADKPMTYRSSFAMFTLGPGEIVNIGYLHFNANRQNLSLFGRPIRKDIHVSDWPLAEIERFKANRPQIYAQMTTRHMTLSDDDGPSKAQCDKLKALKAEGKVQALPVECYVPAAPPAANPPRAPATARRDV